MLRGPLAGETEARVTAARRSPGAGPCVPLWLRASPRPRTALQPRKKADLLREKARSVPGCARCGPPSPRGGSLHRSTPCWRSLLAVPRFPAESLSGPLGECKSEERRRARTGQGRRDAFNLPRMLAGLPLPLKGRGVTLRACRSNVSLKFLGSP